MNGTDHDSWEASPHKPPLLYIYLYRINQVLLLCFFHRTPILLLLQELLQYDHRHHYFCHLFQLLRLYEALVFFFQKYYYLNLKHVCTNILSVPQLFHNFQKLNILYPSLQLIVPKMMN